MKYPEWLEKFQPIQNHINTNADILFETFGIELEFVREQDPHLIWTLVEGDDGELVVVKGWHFVNRMGYHIATVPWTDDDPDEVEDD